MDNLSNAVRIAMAGMSIKEFDTPALGDIAGEFTSTPAENDRTGDNNDNNTASVDVPLPTLQPLVTTVSSDVVIEHNSNQCAYLIPSAQLRRCISCARMVCVSEHTVKRWQTHGVFACHTCAQTITMLDGMLHVVSCILSEMHLTILNPAECDRIWPSTTHAWQPLDTHGLEWRVEREALLFESQEAPDDATATRWFHAHQSVAAIQFIDPIHEPPRAERTSLAHTLSFNKRVEHAYSWLQRNYTTATHMHPVVLACLDDQHQGRHIATFLKPYWSANFENPASAYSELGSLFTTLAQQFLDPLLTDIALAYTIDSVFVFGIDRLFGFFIWLEEETSSYQRFERFWQSNVTAIDVQTAWHAFCKTYNRCVAAFWYRSDYWAQPVKALVWCTYLAKTRPVVNVKQ
jgi:hypothetical protein